MTEETKDIIGKVFWYGALVTPLLTVPMAWRLKGMHKGYRLLIGLLFAVLLSFVFFSIALAIVLRNGLGPG